MTAKNSKSKAVNVDVLPLGRVIKQEGDFVLVEEAPSIACWFHLNPPPLEVDEATALPKGLRVVRAVGNLFQTHGGKWYKLVPPPDTSKLRTYFVVMKVQHEQIISRPDVLLIRYRRDGTTEWVRNIQVAEKKFRTEKKAKIKRYAKAFGAGPKVTQLLQAVPA